MYYTAFQPDGERARPGYVLTQWLDNILRQGECYPINVSYLISGYTYFLLQRYGDGIVVTWLRYCNTALYYSMYYSIILQYCIIILQYYVTVLYYNIIAVGL